MTVIDITQRVSTRAEPYRSIAVIGAGAWGTALAAVAARAGRRTTLWARREEHAAEIVRTGRNERYLGRSPLPPGVLATAKLEEALDGAEAALVVVPSHALREAVAAIAPILAEGAPIALAAKGVERHTGLMMSEVAQQAAPGRRIAALSGPSFADEVMLDLPTAVVIASECAGDETPETSIAARLALSLATPTFRPYASDDIVGVEVGGAVKNVIAIATGMAEGAGFGHNARAALITRGLDEIKRLGHVLGGRYETVSGLSGVGDLSLTASDPKSRNFAYGLRLGRGEPADKGALVEGVLNALSITDLARERGVLMPICESVRSVVHEGVPFADAFRTLWTRPLEGEPRALDLEIAHPASS